MIRSNLANSEDEESSAAACRLDLMIDATVLPTTGAELARQRRNAAVGRSRRWTEEDDERLRRYYEDLRLVWPRSDDPIVRRDYGQNPNKVIAEKLGRSVGAVKYRARELGLPSSTPDKPTISIAEKERVVRRDYGRVPARVIADALGLSVRAVHRYGKKLRLDPYRKLSSWTLAEDDVLRRDYEHTPPKAIAAALRRRPEAVMARAQKLGLSVPGRSGRNLSAQAEAILWASIVEHRGSIEPLGDREAPRGAQVAAWRAACARCIAEGVPAPTQSTVHVWFNNRSVPSHLIADLALSGNLPQTDGL